MQTPDEEDNRRGLRNRIRSSVRDRVYTVVQNIMDQQIIAERVAELKGLYQALPNDELAGILIRSAVRNTTFEGIADGGRITAFEIRHSLLRIILSHPNFALYA